MKTWNENDPRPYAHAPTSRREHIDLDELDDGRCKASTWNPHYKPEKPDYENHFGPGGYNRCIGSEGHANPTHKDEWGHIFVRTEQGSLRILRMEGKGIVGPTKEAADDNT